MSDFYLFELGKQRDKKWHALVEQIQLQSARESSGSLLRLNNIKVSQTSKHVEFTLAVEDPAFEDEWHMFHGVFGLRSWDTSYLQLQIPGDGHTFYTLQRDLTSANTSISGPTNHAIIYQSKQYWLYNIFTLDASFVGDILPILSLYGEALQSLVRYCEDD